ncbi:MAG: hypothetical protein FWF56_06230 [Firmicutes bacterium]|nr:hypothetical protein [Bacillota bacterium]MCL1953379.1 hypothetical protein [Bacillota bacterium]
MNDNAKSNSHNTRNKWLFFSIMFFVFITLSFFIGIFLIGYTNKHVYLKLTTPLVVYDVQSKQVQWHPVDKALGYQVLLDGRDVGYFPQGSHAYPVDYLTSGIHAVSVQAVGIDNIHDSGWSDDLLFSVEQSGTDNYQVLDTPINLYIDNGILHWDKVPNAVSYLIRIENNCELVSRENFVNIEFLKAGRYNIQVKARANCA